MKKDFWLVFVHYFMYGAFPLADSWGILKRHIPYCWLVELVFAYASIVHYIADLQKSIVLCQQYDLDDLKPGSGLEHTVLTLLMYVTLTSMRPVFSHSHWRRLWLLQRLSYYWRSLQVHVSARYKTIAWNNLKALVFYLLKQHNYTAEYLDFPDADIVI